MLRRRETGGEVGPADGAGPSHAAAPLRPLSPTHTTAPGGCDAAAGDDRSRRSGSRSPSLVSLPPDASFAQAGRCGKFTDARVEAEFRADRERRLRSRDAATMAAFGVLQTGVLISHRDGWRPGTIVPTVTAVVVASSAACAAALAGWGPRRPGVTRFCGGILTATLGVLRQSDAPWTYLVPSSSAEGGAATADSAAGSAGRPAGPTPLVILRAPAVVALALLTFGLDAPPVAHGLVSAACLCLGAAIFPRIVRMRVIMHGLAVHEKAAAGLSAVTWALGLRPGEPAPRVMDPLRATMAVTVALYLVVGIAIPSTALFADQRRARHRFRLRHEVHASAAAAAAAAAAARRRWADALLLDLFVLAGFAVGLWALVEEIDAAWPVEAAAAAGA